MPPVERPTMRDMKKKTPGVWHYAGSHSPDNETREDWWYINLASEAHNAILTVHFYKESHRGDSEYYVACDDLNIDHQLQAASVEAAKRQALLNVITTLDDLSKKLKDFLKNG